MIMNNTSKFLKNNIILIVIGFAVVMCLLTTSCKHNADFSIENVEIPAAITGRQEQIITHIGYTVSYNSDWKIPNWVAYELTKEEVEGVTPRNNNFIPDPEVRYDFKSASNDFKMI